MSAIHTTVAGIRIPNSTIARDATQFVGDVSTLLLFEHSRRVFLWGSLYGAQLQLDYDPELFYVAAMFHDIGLVEGHRSPHERFEIDGANAAREFLGRHGVPEEQVTTVWDAIALHTTPEIPRYKRPEVRLVNWGVEYDIPGQHFDELTAEQREAVIAAHPRSGFKEGIIEALAGPLRDKPEPRTRGSRSTSSTRECRATCGRASATSCARPASPPEVAGADDGGIRGAVHDADDRGGGSSLSSRAPATTSSSTSLTCQCCCSCSRSMTRAARTSTRRSRARCSPRAASHA